ncbi:MAG: exosortase F system-associated protein [Flavobacteriaceae bacterium]|nr:exosortase F system-associated protein [Flavobacteriaceae bacterium]
MWSKITRSVVLIVLLLILISIRFFEDVLFYDPYLKFFENDYLYLDSPRRETLKLVLFTSLRYALNSLVSLGLLYTVFRSVSIIKFSLLVYSFSYLILISVFLYFVINPRQEDYYLFFNMRRFLIQPIILLVLFPAFYYNRLNR